MRVVREAGNGLEGLDVARECLRLWSLGFCLILNSRICVFTTCSWSSQMPWDVMDRSYSPTSPMSVSFPSRSHHAQITFTVTSYWQG